MLCKANWSMRRDCRWYRLKMQPFEICVIEISICFHSDGPDPCSVT